MSAGAENNQGPQLVSLRALMADPNRFKKPVKPKSASLLGAADSSAYQASLLPFGSVTAAATTPQPPHSCPR